MPRPSHNKWNTMPSFVEVSFVPPINVTRVMPRRDQLFDFRLRRTAVIGCEYHHGVVGQTMLRQRLEQTPNVTVDLPNKISVRVDAAATLPFLRGQNRRMR